VRIGGHHWKNDRTAQINFDGVSKSLKMKQMRQHIFDLSFIIVCAPEKVFKYHTSFIKLT
jgi:hypothetical protein